MHLKRAFINMVKNTTGGTGTKGLARKHQSRGDSRLRLPGDPLEKIACVTKMLGNGMCEIYTADNVRLIGHIGGKFRGKNKRNNMITIQSVLLVGLRDWERPLKTCEVLTIYEETHIDQLKSIPSVNMTNILKLRGLNMATGDEEHDDFDFIHGNEAKEEETPLQTGKTKEVFKLENTLEVNIDDI
jgi:translation initiation factor IF-1